MVQDLQVSVSEAAAQACRYTGPVLRLRTATPVNGLTRPGALGCDLLTSDPAHEEE